MLEYNQFELEKKWQKIWQDEKIYNFDFYSNKKIYSIDVPPRYASGPLHAGHAVHYTHIDFAARYKRMRGYNVFFPLCFDVNGIPIEERVERQLNITRKDIDRHKFTKLCSEFAEKNIKTMIKQFIILGESMDPSIYYQTNAEYYRRLTQISFIELFNKGYIYKGEFPVNWCPRCMTAMADAEVVYINRKTKLNTIKFYFKENPEKQLFKYHSIKKDNKGSYIEIATTRPEMLPSCQIVAVHPQDERAPWLDGQIIIVPIFNKQVKIIRDKSVDPEFGTGIVMICTVGDKEDLNWVFKYKLPIEMSIDEEGKMTDICGVYRGMKINDARKKILKDMEKDNLLIKQEPLEQNIGVCWRCKTPVEFINAKQWFLKTTIFKELVLKKSNEMKWYPEFMKIRLEEWVNSLQWDWVISRQRYFATPIPLWECKKCNKIILAKPEDCYVDPTINKSPFNKCPKCGGKIIGCQDVFDTWMDSSITPLFNSYWYRDDNKFKKYYPMSLRPQAHDIIRTWAFYTILRCSLITDQKPFENIMMGGFILSEDGTPMHASLGNVIDPLNIINKYGSDAFRCYAASCGLGEDNPFRIKDVIRGVKLLRKIWNIQQFVKKIINNKKPKKTELIDIDKWIITKYSKLVKKCTKQMDEFNYSQTLKDIEYFLWHELADHYIEMIKGSIYENKNVESIRYTLYTVVFGTLKLFAPFFPHITEEIYNNFYKIIENEDSIHLSTWPIPVLIDTDMEKSGELIKSYISKVRSWKSEHGMPLNSTLLSSATYFTSKEDLKKIKPSRLIVISTLKFPKNHQFFYGKPNIEEKIVKIIPVYSKIGPKFKKNSEKIVDWIINNQNEIIKITEKKGDILLSEIPIFKIKEKNGLLKDGYIQIKKDIKVKGKRDSLIIPFDNFYLELKDETI